jgi:hypothetical protein
MGGKCLRLQRQGSRRTIQETPYSPGAALSGAHAASSRGLSAAAEQRCQDPSAPLMHPGPPPEPWSPRSPEARNRGICSIFLQWSQPGSNRRPPACKEPATRIGSRPAGNFARDCWIYSEVADRLAARSRPLRVPSGFRPSTHPVRWLLHGSSCSNGRQSGHSRPGRPDRGIWIFDGDPARLLPAGRFARALPRADTTRGSRVLRRPRRPLPSCVLK